MISVDTNILTHAANKDSPFCLSANQFIQAHQHDETFVLCELALVELYMNLRNPSIMRKPHSAKIAYAYCQALRSTPAWQVVDYHSDVAATLWEWAKVTPAGFRKIIDARMALTLKYHGIEAFATQNTRDFEAFGFKKLWNPLLDS